MLVQKLMGDTFEINLKTYDQNDGKMKMKNPSQDLFIWSILMVHQDMAKTFWIKGKDALSSALVAYKLLKSLKSKTENTNTKLANTIDECLNEWSELSVGVLSDCNANDEQKTRELLVRKVSIWGETSCFLIAVNSVNKEFIAEKACQTFLNNIWNGGLANENSFLRLLSCMFCPFLVITVLKYNIDNKKYSKNGKGKIHAKTGVGKANSVESNRQNLKKSTDEKRSFIGRKPSVEMTTGKHQITPREKLYHFFKAPVIICMYNVLSYIVFLSMFAFLLIFNFGSSLSSLDIALMVWVFTIFTEEVRQMGTPIPSKMCSKLHVYISDVWNKLDIFTIVLFITGMTVRFLPYNGALEAARVMLALNFISFCLRLLHIFSVHKHLGPKLVMMPKMLEDLMYFIVILLVFVVSYAIASHSILYHNSLPTWKTVTKCARLMRCCGATVYTHAALVMWARSWFRS
ncbi:hypothetical protein DPMN_092257 [Dreissena polymorpha]|uniref:Ion transport domain-containing protein n=1 Tax=Dreissena polymorpha TaxID=45954 RepID=A0A9D4R0Q1_DREPO|nr:hypothetical protein DPMN_092257 [Dreissena polymorpha]